MFRFEHLSIAEIHMHAAREAWVKAANGAHNIDALELVGPIFFEDGRILHRIFIGTRSSVNITRIRVPGCWWIGMIVGYLAVANDNVMRKNAAHRFVEAAANRLLGNLEVRPGLRVACVKFGERLFDKVKRCCGGVGLEIGASAIPLDSIAPLGNLPLKLSFGFHRGFGQVDLDTVARRFYIGNVDEAGKGRGPKPGNGPAAGIKGKMVAGALVKPPRRHHPCVIALEIALLGTWNCGLIPGMVLVYWIAEGIPGDKGFCALPVVVVRTAQQDT